MDDSISDLSKPTAKGPVVRGARACTVCRTAKMKCVGAEDGQKQCQRCKRANVECVFEKHRRGRKPGSKLSEASKTLRRLEKGLSAAKLKSQANESGTLLSVDQFGSPTGSRLPQNPPPFQSGDNYAHSSSGSRMDMDDDDEDNDRNEEGLFPARLIKKANQRNSFFRTILNPESNESKGASASQPTRGSSHPPPLSRSVAPSSGPDDPITAGIIKEDQAKMLFELFFLRLNPFVNLFDPVLHSVTYVRSKCPFLFTTLIMAGCKFFKPELFKPCQILAGKFAIKAFEEGWKRVEVVQAFACLTYWKDPDDTRTWTYIGYACRMAVGLGLNRYVATPPPHETELQLLERRNRERTYLVLWVHDRSLSMQTGKHWMLPEDDLVRHSRNWHEEGGSSIRAEDVIIAAFVNLRQIAADTTDMFSSTKGVPGSPHNNDVNHEVVLKSCNGRLVQWNETWQREMQRAGAGGDTFRLSFLTFFSLHVRLFLNSFGVQASMLPQSLTSPSVLALNACYQSGLQTLRIVSKDFATVSMLRYGQDSITVMVAYSAVFLLRLLRSPNTSVQISEETTREIYSLINKTADAYSEASQVSPESTNAAYHARFLRNLVSNDVFNARMIEKERIESMPLEPARLHVQQNAAGNSTPQMYSPPVGQQANTAHYFPPSARGPTHPQSALGNEYQEQRQPQQQHPQLQLQQPLPLPPRMSVSDTTSNYHPHYPAHITPSAPHHASELDAHYWKNMFSELGYGDNSPETHGYPQQCANEEDIRGMGPSPPSSAGLYPGDGVVHQQQVHHHQSHPNSAHSQHLQSHPQQSRQQHQPQQHQQHQHQHQQLSYHHMHPPGQGPGYGH